MTDRPVHYLTDEGLAHPVAPPGGAKAKATRSPARVTCPLCEKKIPKPAENRPTLTPEPNRPETLL